MKDLKLSICLESLKIARTLFALMLFHYKRRSLLKYNQNVNDAWGGRFSYLPGDLNAKEKENRFFVSSFISQEQTSLSVHINGKL